MLTGWVTCGQLVRLVTGLFWLVWQVACDRVNAPQLGVGQVRKKVGFNGVYFAHIKGINHELSKPLSIAHVALKQHHWVCPAKNG